MCAVLIIHRTLGFSMTNPTMHAFLNNDPKVNQEEKPYFESAPPFESDHTPSEKPTLLYLPGLDGSGLSAVQQFHDLDNSFDLHRLYIPPPTRLSFEDLVICVQDYINEKFEGRRVTLVGESFGGLLATAVAASHSTSPSLNVVLLNPATSFQSTNWKTLAPVLTSTVGKTPAYPYVGGGVLAATVPSLYQSKKLAKELISGFAADPLSLPTKGQELLNTFAESINKRLPPDVVKFRVLEWCEVGSKKVRVVVESGFPGNFITCS